MRTLRIAAPLLVIAAGCHDDAPSLPAAPAVAQPITTRLELRDEVRRLWAQRGFWTRNYLVDVLDELPSQDTTLQRLMQNQVALGEAMKPFHGDAAGTQLTAALQENVTHAGQLIIATRDGEEVLVEHLTARWQESTDRLAEILADQNQALSRTELQLQLRRLRDATLQQVNERLAKNWDGELSATDAAMAHSLLLADAIAGALTAQFPAKIAGQEAPASETALHLELRALWMEHVSWQRLHLVSDVSQLADVTAVANRLTRNQAELGSALAPFPGSSVGTQVADLLTVHVVRAGEFLQAARSADELARSAALEQWQASADSLAAFLASANPFVDQTALKTLLRAHLEQLAVEMSARLNGDFAGEIAAHELVEEHILRISDAISRALSQQQTMNVKPEG